MSVRAPVGNQSDYWETPQWLFDALNTEFGFTLDGAATRENRKCSEYSNTTESTPVGRGWQQQRVFVNPPYSRINDFVDAALIRSYAATVVMLLPVRTDSNWFRRFIESDRATIRFFRKRIAFVSDGVPMKSPPFASMVVIINGG